MDARTRFAPFLLFGRYQRESRGGSIAGPAWQACHALYRVLDGTLALEGGGRRWRLRSGEAGFADPGTVVHWRGEVRLLRLAFDLVPRPRICRANGYVDTADWQPQPGWREIFGCEPVQRLAPAFLLAHELLLHRLATTQLRDPLRHLVAHAELARLITAVLQDQQAGASGSAVAPAPHGDLASRVEELLMGRAASGGTVGDVARLLGLSPAHLSRRYRQQRGHAPSSFLQRWRVHCACTLISGEPKRSFAEIAREVGFAGGHSLNRAFAAVLGCSPSVWRRKASWAEDRK